jgi:hypothetical protein
MKKIDPLNKLMSEAHADPHLRAKLLRNPEAVAEERGVELGEEEIARLKKLGAFTELVAEVKNGRLSRGCDPRVCYPVTIWEGNAFKDLVAELVPSWRRPIFYPIFYPIYYSIQGPLQSGRINYERAAMRSSLGKIDQVYYPPDDRYLISKISQRLVHELTVRLEAMLEEKLKTNR